MAGGRHRFDQRQIGFFADRVLKDEIEGTEDTERKQNFTSCSPKGKEILISVINSLTAGGFRPLWDLIGDAVEYANSSGSSRLPIVILMTDGEDNLVMHEMTTRIDDR